VCSTALKKILEWLKMVAKLPKLLPRRRQEPEPAPGVLSELDKKLGQEIQKREERMGRPLDTRQGGPNMPRYQFCSCGRSARRTRKTAGGANYKCSIHGEFFVRAPSL
jgi:hypothetical protein